MPPRVVKGPHVMGEAVVLAPPPAAGSSSRRGGRGSSESDDDLAEVKQRRRQVLERARHEARRIADAARSDAERMRVEAREQGYQDGLTVGNQEAEQAVREAAEATVGQYLRRLGELIERAQVDRATLIRDAEADLVELAVAVAEKVLRERLSADERTTVAEIARDGLGRLAATGTESARVRVHPEDFEGHRDVWDQLALEGAAGIACEVVPDERIEKGGCLVETRAARIDGQWSSQIAQLRAALVADNSSLTSEGAPL